MFAHVRFFYGKNRGQTALHIACQSGNLAVVSALIDAEADLQLKDDDGNTPLDSAKNGPQPWATQLLLQERGIKEQLSSLTLAARHDGPGSDSRSESQSEQSGRV